MKLLHIDSSISGEGSASRQLSAAVVAALTRAMPDLEVVRRDLDAEPIPHLDSRRLPTVRPANAPEGAIGIADAEGAGALDEFLAADVVVIGAPMYNFTIPSQLKAWIDRIVIAGKTFRYSETGPVGLAGGKRVIIASSRGGLYAPGMPFEANDFQEKYLHAIFAFIGVEDIEIVRAEGLAFGPEPREAAIRAAFAALPSAVMRLALATVG
ncbi:MAG TPA: FMN-dependent NADH-azoreductase [Stellaceae bacterium]|nr:FMN-dependent NADH-azoreductase [Stellaceae bacterium]